MSTVYWITGFAGAGKTTIGKLFYEKLKEHYPNTVFLDGDLLRRVFGDDLGYSESDRRKCAMRYSRLCRMLQQQGINVVCCTISMFHEIRAWNRDNIASYAEIYLKVGMEVLAMRDQKGLYSGNTKEKDSRVAGLHIAYEEPKSPDLVLVNDGSKTPKEQVEIMMDWLQGTRKQETV